MIGNDPTRLIEQRLVSKHEILNLQNINAMDLQMTTHRVTHNRCRLDGLENESSLKKIVRKTMNMNLKSDVNNILMLITKLMKIEHHFIFPDEGHQSTTYLFCFKLNFLWQHVST
uniref:Uncharacterized protein n=1 Tax=Cacopsylla melanoneura TaxID=428564 RepID=A0A8D9BM87_9HEMI